MSGSGASVRPENAVTYSAGNGGQTICGGFSETAPLQRSNTPSAIRTVGHFPAEGAHAHYALIVRTWRRGFCILYTSCNPPKLPRFRRLWYIIHSYGNQTRTCINTGLWSGEEPTCLRMRNAFPMHTSVKYANVKGCRNGSANKIVITRVLHAQSKNQ